MERLSRFDWARFVRVGTLAALVLATTVPAIASNQGSFGSSGTGGTTNGIWFTNNANFVVAERSLTSATAAAVDTIESTYDSTDLDLTDVTASECVDAAYDTCVYDENYGDIGFRGWNACWGSTSGSHPSQECSVTWVRVNLYYSDLTKSYIMCHELGHSIGLKHGTGADSCMESWPRTNQLSPHDKIMTNSWY